MKLLLDTHTLFWWTHTPTLLSAQVRAMLKKTSNPLFISVVSLWELQIKRQAGKMTLTAQMSEFVDRVENLRNVTVLSITSAHILDLDNLLLHHRDPFDRMLIAQARVEGATLVSKDGVFSQYDVSLL